MRDGTSRVCCFRLLRIDRNGVSRAHDLPAFLGLIRTRLSLFPPASLLSLRWRNDLSSFLSAPPLGRTGFENGYLPPAVLGSSA